MDASVVLYPTGHKESWSKGEQAYFEYHCLRSHASADAQLWYRDHQAVTVIATVPCDGQAYQQRGENLITRCDDGAPLVYQVKFSDGFIGTACEDELYSSADSLDPDLGPPTDWQTRAKEGSEEKVLQLL